MRLPTPLSWSLAHESRDRRRKPVRSRASPSESPIAFHRSYTTTLICGYDRAMRIRVKLFAILRDRAGCGELELKLADAANVDAALAHIAEGSPAIADLLPCAAIAVNLEYVNRDQVLKDGDELALIPPVSGG